MPDIDRRAIFLERQLDDLDRPVDPGAEAARRAEHDVQLRLVHHGVGDAFCRPQVKSIVWPVAGAAGTGNMQRQACQRIAGDPRSGNVRRSRPPRAGEPDRGAAAAAGRQGPLAPGASSRPASPPSPPSSSPAPPGRTCRPSASAARESAARPLGRDPVPARRPRTASRRSSSCAPPPTESSPGLMPARTALPAPASEAEAVDPKAAGPRHHRRLRLLWRRRRRTPIVRSSSSRRSPPATSCSS